MVGAPWELGDKPVNTPIFKQQNDRDGKWIFTPMKEWSKNDCNQFKLDILFTGPVIHDAWEYETVYIPTGFYKSFDEFSVAFNLAILNGITLIFKRTNAHPTTTEIKHFWRPYRKEYQLAFWQRHRALRRYHRILDTIDSEVADGIKILTGGTPYNLMSTITDSLSIAQGLDTFTHQATTALDGRFEEMVKRNEWVAEIGEIGEYIKMADYNYSWIELSKYIKEGYPTVAAISVVEEFHKATNFSMKINRFMQYQLGFTINSLFDMGWINWYARNEAIETTKLPTLYWYGSEPPNLSNNPLRSMCVHCDIIEGSYVGKSQKPLLRVLPVNIISHIVSYESFAVLQYRHINKNNVSAISVWLTETPDGEPIDLRSLVIIKLQFVRNG